MKFMKKLYDWITSDLIDDENIIINPNAISLFDVNEYDPYIDIIQWYYINKNTNHEAIALLEKNQDKISWWCLSRNPSIFQYDYENMKRPFTEELIQERFHPKNFDKFDAWGY